MKRNSIIFILFFCLPIHLSGQSSVAPLIVWQKTFGGIHDDIGYAVSPARGNEEEYVIAGSTSSFGNGFSDVYFIRIDADGDAVWTRTYGGTGFDYSYSVQQTSGDGFIITGYSSSIGASDPDVYLLKTDSMGDTLWTKTFGGENYEYGRSVQQTYNGGYIVAGYTSSFGSGGADVYLLKTNEMGDTLWTKTYGGKNTGIGWSVQQTGDGGYIITGSKNSLKGNNIDVYLLRTDADGLMLWEKNYGGKDEDIGYSVQQTADGGFIITGKTGSFGAGFTDVCLIKTDADGDTLWTKTFGGPYDDYGNFVRQTADDGYIITGETYSFGAGNADVYLIRTDSLGNELWSTNIGGDDDDIGYSVQQTADGGYIVAGSTKSYGTGKKDVFVIKVKEKTTQPVNRSTKSTTPPMQTELSNRMEPEEQTPEEVLTDFHSSPEIIYKVQFLMTESPINPNNPEYAGILDVVSEQTGEKMYKHMTGTCYSLHDANKLQYEIRRKGYKGAFIVAYKNGNRIKVQVSTKTPPSPRH